MALQDRDPHGPYTQGPIWPIIGLGWVVSSLFSVPWPYIFQRTMHRDGEKPATVAKAAKMSLGIGLLIFLACGLILLGFAAIVYPIASPLQGDVSLADQSLGFLMATVGIALAVYICQNTEKLGLDYQIDSLFGWLLGLIALTVVPSIFLDLHEGSYHCAPSATNCTQLGPPLQEFLNFVAALEALVVVIWLLRRGRRAKKKTRLLRSES
jgi:Na+-driven multidrug efflux pump